MPEALYNLEESFRLSRLPVVRAAEILGAICFDDLVARRHEMASNELLIARLPEVHLNYLKFQQTLNDQGTDLQAYLSGVFHDLGCKPDTSAIILPDQYPANVQPAEHGLPAVHYNLWLRNDVIDKIKFEAGEAALSALTNRDSEREVHCFKRQLTQSVPEIDGFLWQHGHIFTQAVLPSAGYVLV